jgi:hypothetical protein
MAFNIQTPVTGITGMLGTGAFENYMASTVEEITLGRNPVTSIAPLPNRVFDVVWKMNLNLALGIAGVKSPSVIDASEQVQTLVSANTYEFTLTTNNLSININVGQVLASTTYTLTYMSLTGTGTSIVAAAAVLATRLSTNGSTVTVLTDSSQNVYSSLSPNYTTVVSTTILNPLGAIGATGTASFMAYLKAANGNVGSTGSWYAANTWNNQSIQTQVKLGLAQLFDKDPQLNNLIGSAATSSTFLDSSKIASKMQSTTDTFWTKFFSDQQFREVLSAVADKGSRVAIGGIGATGINTFNFLPGDTISAMLKVTDTDTSSLNSDRWMITLQQV